MVSKLDRLKQIYDSKNKVAVNASSTPNDNNLGGGQVHPSIVTNSKDQRDDSVNPESQQHRMGNHQTSSNHASYKPESTRD